MCVCVCVCAHVCRQDRCLSHCLIPFASPAGNHSLCLNPTLLGPSHLSLAGGLQLQGLFSEGQAGQAATIVSRAGAGSTTRLVSSSMRSTSHVFYNTQLELVAQCVQSEEVSGRHGSLFAAKHLELLPVALAPAAKMKAIHAQFYCFALCPN